MWAGRARTVVRGSLGLGGIEVIRSILRSSYRGWIGARWSTRDNILCSLSSQRSILIALEQSDLCDYILAVSRI